MSLQKQASVESRESMEALPQAVQIQVQWIRIADSPVKRVYFSGTSDSGTKKGYINMNNTASTREKVSELILSWEDGSTLVSVNLANTSDDDYDSQNNHNYKRSADTDYTATAPKNGSSHKKVTV